MTFKAKDFEQRLRMLESIPGRDRGKPDDASWDRPAARPPPVLFPVVYKLNKRSTPTSTNLTEPQS